MQYSSEKEDFSCRSGDGRNTGFILMVRRCNDFGMGNSVLIVGTKEFGKFIWRDNKKRIDHHL